MAEYLIRAANEWDNEALCSLCELPMAGTISLSFPRRPDFFLSNSVQVQSRDLYVLESFKTQEIHGMFSVGSRLVFVNGKAQSIPYFSDLRIAPKARGGRALFELCAYAANCAWMQNRFGQTIVFSDNRVMLDLVEKLQQRGKKNSWFLYHEAGDLLSWMISLRKKFPQKNISGIKVRKAIAQDIPSLQKFWNSEASKKQFAPVYAFDSLGQDYYQGLSIADYFLAFDGEELVGCCSIWDQSSFRQTRVDSYSGALKYFRGLVNLLSSFWGDIELPSAGKELAYLSLHTLAVQGNRPDILLALIQAIRSAFSGGEYKYLLLGMDAKDPLQKAMDLVPSKRPVKGKHFLVSGKKDFKVEKGSVFYFEVARI